MLEHYHLFANERPRAWTALGEIVEDYRLRNDEWLLECSIETTNYGLNDDERTND